MLKLYFKRQFNLIFWAQISELDFGPVTVKIAQNFPDLVCSQTLGELVNTSSRTIQYCTIEVAL